MESSPIDERLAFSVTSGVGSPSRATRSRNPRKLLASGREYPGTPGRCPLSVEQNPLDGRETRPEADVEKGGLCHGPSRLRTDPGDWDADRGVAASRRSCPGRATCQMDLLFGEGSGGVRSPPGSASAAVWSVAGKPPCGSTRNDSCRPRPRSRDPGRPSGPKMRAIHPR